MKTKITFLIFFTIIVIIFLSAFTRSNSNSPCDVPLVGDHTGAPGETNCTGCHLGTNNAGPGTVIFDVGGSITQYVPGQTYLCTVTINQTGIDKMGYACTALRNSNNSADGIFSLTEPARTRLFTSGGRNYCSHNPCGADASTIGTNSWTFNWQAPSSNVGNITLYIGALATNHNHATTGDDAYTTTVILTPSATSVNEIQAVISNLDINPNPVSDFLNISFENISGVKMEIELLDIAGKKILTLHSERDVKGKVHKSFDVSKISKGVYWIRISERNKSVSRKILIM